MLTSIIVHNVDEIERELESTRRTGGRSGVAMASPSEQSTNPAQQMAKFWNIYCHEVVNSFILSMNTKIGMSK